LKEYLGEDNKEIALNQILKDNWQNIAENYCDENGVNLLLTHLFMMKKGMPKPEEPEGEKPIMIGNADLIYSEIIPEQIQYSALGHLHNYQNIGTIEKPVVYSSSSLCYSFSEAGQKKSVTIIEAEPNQNVSVKNIPLTQGRSLFRKTFNEVEKAVDWLKENPDSLVELTLENDTFLKAEDRKLLYQTHNGIIHLIPKLNNVIIDSSQTDKNIDLNQDIQDLFRDYFKSRNQNQEPNDGLLSIFKEII
jgi:exonuclease SbcD